MSLRADLDTARLTALLDLRHPQAYLALHPTIAFGASLGIDVNWLPVVAPPLNAPSEPGEGDDRGVRHRRYRAQAIAREIEAYGEAQGLKLRECYRDGPADAANRAWLWVRDRHPEKLVPFLVELFRAYWAVELDPADAAEVAALVERVGADGAGFRAWEPVEGGAAAEALAAELAERGIAQAPSFLVEDELFWGRQHLPMIRWILEGRSGPGPI